MRNLILAPLALFLVACTISEDDFPAEYAETWCDRYEECEADDFDSIWGDQESCQDDIDAAAELWLDLADLGGETYDESKGYECVKEVRQADCDDIEDNDVSCDLWADE